MKDKVELWVRELEEYFFCPLVFYYSAVLGIGKDSGYWADLGKELQEEAEKKISEMFNVYDKELEVSSESLGVKGKVDFVVEIEGSFAPLEVKYSFRMRPWWKYSAILYAILLEDTFNKPVKFCFLYLTESDRLVKIKITDEDRQFVFKSVEDCRRILKGVVPKPKVSKSCENCDYVSLCFERV